MPLIKVNDVNLYYEIHGEGEPVCLIPGLNNDITDYKKIIQLLSQKFKVIVFDNRGSGRSDKPDIPYSIQMMSDDITELLKHIDIKNAHIIGVSLGGRIAVELTLRHPAMVKSLTLVSTYVHRIEQNLSSRRLGILLLLSPLLKIGKKYPQPHYAVVRQRDAAREYDATEKLFEINAPTLILHGRRDKFAPIHLAEEMHTKIKNSKLITFEGGHLFLFLKMETFVETVTNFLESIKH